MNNNSFKINNSLISGSSNTYFIADIAANHNGDLNKAKELIYMAKEAGADAAKFQHFRAGTIVSDHGFKNLGQKMSHQAKWSKSVYEVYQDAEVPLDWTPELYKTCKDAEIDFFTSPYDMKDIDYIDQFVPAYKVGSGDITFHEIVMKMAAKKKPILIATGASTIDDVVKVMAKVEPVNSEIVLMQCNTNYTALPENFRHINLNVLKVYAEMFPNAIIGLSDHTLGCATVLGAVSLGAKVIEKHFTDNNDQAGPDHPFSMNPVTWREMVDRTRELEYALGSAVKKVEDNEKDTYIVQRRAVRAARDIKSGETITSEMLISLRPCPANGLPPYETEKVIGKKSNADICKGDIIKWENIYA